MNCTIYVVKTKALISFAVTAKLICVFVFAYAKSRFSHEVAHMIYKEKCFRTMENTNNNLDCFYDTSKTKKIWAKI